MLRRKPTAITLTTEDIAIYEDKRIREAQEKAQAEAQALRRQAENRGEPHDELPQSARAAEKAPARTREERLGLAPRY
ncbi:hypothetical protein PVAG01_06305 [Phlyctema vagabunda]|uniref:Anaphase-promoting complex, subunit CDC26 n=1 Tax=Phlyctema vagabunda TaxID=108571 RepID=A0ABR4PFP0_9HELO